MRRLGYWMLALVVLAGALAGPGFAEGPEIEAPSAILMDAATGTVLYEKNADERLRPASVTKIMTLLLVMEALDQGKIGINDTITASETASAKGGSQIYLEPGEQMPLEEMLKAVVVSSANDCATALAEHVAGSEAAFVDQMNERAEALGMTNTHFVNCTGLDDEPEAEAHLSTARDIALMSRELLRHDRIRTYTTIWMDTVRGGAFGLTNTNKLIRFYDGATGLKTGYTSAAGHCLSASAERSGMELIAVVLHCGSSSERFHSAKALLDYGFAGWALIDPTPEDAIAPIPVTLGQAEQIQPVLEDRSKLLIDKAQQKGITKQVTLCEAVEAPVLPGQQLGLLRIESDGVLLKEIPLVAADSVPKLTFGDLFLRLLNRVCMGA